MSTEIKDDESAFPIVVPNPEGFYQTGMTLRDYFAAAALQGMLSNSVLHQGYSSAKERAKEACEFADAMLAEREKKGGAA